MEESFKDYHAFCEQCLIEVLIEKRYPKGTECVGRKRFGGSNLTCYYFKHPLCEKIWEYDVPDRIWLEIASKHHNFRPRFIK